MVMFSFFASFKAEKNFIVESSELHQNIHKDYRLINAPSLSFEAYQQAIKGFRNLSKQNPQIKKNLIGIVDFSKSSNQKRFYIIDLNQNKVLYHTLVAHGQKSGEEFANYFSNIPESHQSSLGFYQTLNTYHGKHGLSLRLEGLEKCNDKAFDRAIVIHQADYVSKEFIRKNGRLGRSFGCPALPSENYEEIIDLIKEGMCLFIYHPSPDYHASSEILKDSNI